jgi:hypothetical protein
VDEFGHVAPSLLVLALNGVAASPNPADGATPNCDSPPQGLALWHPRNSACNQSRPLRLKQPGLSARESLTFRRPSPDQ